MVKSKLIATFNEYQYIIPEFWNIQIVVRFFYFFADFVVKTSTVINVWTNE